MIPEVSVVIPSFNRRERLLGLLEELRRQTLDPSRFEVIVVSDGSTDGTPEAVSATAARLPFAVELLEGRHAGPGQARNLGVARARAPIVAFTDDDVLPEPRWLEEGLDRFRREPFVAGVEGLTRPELGPGSLFRLNLSNLLGGLYPTCNIFYRKSVLESVGGFDAAFRFSSEDSDLAFRVLDRGGEIAFEPLAAVRHVSQLSSPWLPLRIATHYEDDHLLEVRYPGRRNLRARFYRSDAAKIGLLVGAVDGVFIGEPWIEVLAFAGFTGLVLRSMWREVIPGRIRRLRTWAALFLAYSAAPFANLYYLLRGLLRARSA